MCGDSNQPAGSVPTDTELDELLRAYFSVKDAVLRRTLLRLIEAIADGKIDPDLLRDQ